MILSPPTYDQVLTGELPYGNSNRVEIVRRITSGARPSRPTDRDQNRWLRDPVWDVITTCWRDEPRGRCELSVMHDTFLTSSRWEAQNAKLDDSNDQQPEPHDNRKVANAETGLQQLGKMLPRITSLFQFLRDSKPEIERRVNEMDKVSPSVVPTVPQRLTQVTAPGGLYYIGSRTFEAVQ